MAPAGCAADRPGEEAPEISGAWTEFKVARGEIHTVGEKPEKPPVDAAPVMLDDIREEFDEAVDADDVTEVEEAADAIEAVGAAADDTIEITTVEDTDATETDEA